MRIFQPVDDEPLKTGAKCRENRFVARVLSSSGPADCKREKGIIFLFFFFGWLRGGGGRLHMRPWTLNWIKLLRETGGGLRGVLLGLLDR